MLPVLLNACIDIAAMHNDVFANDVFAIVQLNITTFRIASAYTILRALRVKIISPITRLWQAAGTMIGRRSLLMCAHFFANMRCLSVSPVLGALRREG
ncbi:hypothetical protein GYB62_01495 [bacterium]|nr:hypothetical protein [bacterium]